MPKKLPRNLRKTEIVAFRVTQDVFRDWDKLKRNYVGFERKFKSPQDLFTAMIDTFKKSLRPKVVSR